MDIDSESEITGYIPIQKLSAVLGISKATLRRWERVKTMPQSIRFGGRIRFWKLETIRKWIETLESVPIEMHQELMSNLEKAANFKGKI